MIVYVTFFFFYRPPRQFSLSIVACFYPPTTTTAIVEVTTETATTTTSFTPTTTTMNYCVEERGMNQPLIIRTDQVSTNPSVTPTDINPTSSTSGLNFTTMNPEISIRLDQPATLTLVYLPVDRTDQPSNVREFNLVFVYPNGSQSDTYPSTNPDDFTTTPSSGTTSETTTAVSTTAGVFPPSILSPQVNLPTNFQVPEGTVLVIKITRTSNFDNPTNVSIIFH